MKKNADFNSFMTEVPIRANANQWTGFCMIGTSVMKELGTKETHKSSSIKQRSDIFK